MSSDTRPSLPDFNFDESFQKGWIPGLKVGNGLCACGALDQSIHFVCSQHPEHLVCLECGLRDLDGHLCCRASVEERYGIKQDAMVLLTVICGLPRNKAKQLTHLPKEILEDVQATLIAVKYAERKGTGLLGGRLLVTQRGVMGAIMMLKAFSGDQDFRLFLKRLSEVSSDWKELVMAETAR